MWTSLSTASRAGLGGMLLVLLPLTAQHFSIVVLILSGIWILLSIAAQREYVATIRKRLELRRLDLDSARLTVSDPATIQMLERTARGDNPRQAAYALDLLGESARYDPSPMLTELAGSAHAEVRAKAFETARKIGNKTLGEAALAEIRNARTPDGSQAACEAVRYAVTVSPEPADFGRRLLEHNNPDIPSSLLDALTDKPDLARQILDLEWLRTAAADSSPVRRALAAQAIGVRGDAGTEALFKLLNDSDPLVAGQAIRTVGALKNREYLGPVVRALGSARLRGPAIDALVEFGPKIIGALGDLLEDETLPLQVRRYVPRVLQRIVDQRSVDVLVRGLPTKDLTMRAAILKGLNKLRDAKPDLEYHAKASTEQILAEAKYYFDLHASLAPLRTCQSPKSATCLLTKTLEDRLRVTLERLFRLLGLRYPPHQIYAAYRAIDRRGGDDYTAALEFLDNVLERDLKRVLLPMLDEDAVLAQHAHELFQIERRDSTRALRSLIQSGDAWLASCSIIAAAELGLNELAREIQQAGSSGGQEVAEVARAAEALMV